MCLGDSSLKYMMMSHANKEMTQVKGVSFLFQISRSQHDKAEYLSLV